MTLHPPGASRRPRVHGRRAFAVAVSVVLAIAGASMTTGASAAPETGPPGSTVSAETAREIAALQRVKSTATQAERKLDSQLLLTVRRQADASSLAATPNLQLGTKVSKAGTTVLDIRVTRITTSLQSRLKAVGAVVTDSWDDAGVVRATVPLRAVTTVASWADVKHVAPPVGAQNQAATPSTNQSPQVVRADQGDIVSEGDRADGAAQARQRFRVTGTGVKVCVLSDGIDSLADSQAAGELPDVDVLPGQAGSGDEGTAMLEIVHDLAPNATLGFATAFDGEASFAQNIRDLRFEADCDVIVDDVIYYDESPFQDGPLAQAVDAVHADGASYFSSAGNQGNLLSGTSGTWEGEFADSGQGVGKFAGTAHDFDPGAGVQVFDPLSPNSAGTVTTLFWADPAGRAADDYDLYVFNSSGSVVALSQDVQDGDDDPFEILQIPSGSGLRLAVVKFSGADRFLQVTTFGGRFMATDGLRAFATTGSQRGHADAEGATSVAAAPADEPLPFLLEAGDPPNPSGPYPKAFNRRQVPEPFTSDGPRRIFFEADGTPITPGNTSSTGGEVRAKPEILAADGVRTSVDGFDPFFGTSAAAPHAAAVAALVRSGKPGIDPDAVTAAMRASAIDLAPQGFDPRSGAGALRADSVLARTGAVPQPQLTVSSPSVAPAGDGDAYLEPGETGVLSIPVANTGDGPADQVAAAVTSTAPGVTITPTSRSYGRVAPGASVRRTFTIALPASYPNGRPVPLTVRITSIDTAPRTVTTTVPTGKPSSTPTVVSYAGDPVPIPDGDAVGVSVPLVVSGVGYASSVQLSIDGTACTTDVGATTVGIDHTYVRDLVGTLVAPDGATAQLFSRSGEGGNNLCQVVFADSATEPFSATDSTDAPYTGTYRPIDPLGDLLSGTVDGTWSLRVADLAPADTGSVRAFSLRFTTFEAP